MQRTSISISLAPLFAPLWLKHPRKGSLVVCPSLAARCTHRLLRIAEPVPGGCTHGHGLSHAHPAAVGSLRLRSVVWETVWLGW